MTLELPNLYHWSPSVNRGKIKRRGLRPTVETAIVGEPVPPGVGHIVVDDEIETALAICLGTSAATAWALSGYYSAEVDESWDLWEVRVTDDDVLHYMPTKGATIDEIRVINRIPKSRVWYAGTRLRTAGRRWHAG